MDRWQGKTNDGRHIEPNLLILAPRMVEQINDGFDRRLICFANSRELAKPNVGTARQQRF